MTLGILLSVRIKGSRRARARDWSQFIAGILFSIAQTEKYIILTVYNNFITESILGIIITLSANTGAFFLIDHVFTFNSICGGVLKLKSI